MEERCCKQGNSMCKGRRQGGHHVTKALDVGGEVMVLQKVIRMSGCFQSQHKLRESNNTNSLLPPWRSEVQNHFYLAKVRVSAGLVPSVH